MGGSLAALDVSAAEFKAPGQYQAFTFDVNVPRRLDDVEYRLLYPGTARLWLDTIAVAPVQVSVPLVTYEAEAQDGDAGRSLADEAASEGRSPPAWAESRIRRDAGNGSGPGLWAVRAAHARALPRHLRPSAPRGRPGWQGCLG